VAAAFRFMSFVSMSELLSHISRRRPQDVVLVVYSGQIVVSSHPPHFATRPQIGHDQPSAPQHIQQGGNLSDCPYPDAAECPNSLCYKGVRRCHTVET
jgi:hypothetical protein